MKQPAQHLIYGQKLGPVRQNGSIDHQNRHAKRPRGVQLGARTGSTRVLGYDQRAAMPFNQRLVIFFRKGAARNHNLTIRQRQGFGRVDQSQKIVMLGLRGKILKMHPTYCQKDALRRAVQRRNSCGDIRHMLPPVPLLRDPFGACERRQFNPGIPTGRHRIAAHLRGKRMGCVDHMADPVVSYVLHEAFDTTETTNPNRQGLWARITHPSGVGIGRRDATFRHGLRQRICFGRATQNEYFGDPEVGHA